MINSMIPINKHTITALVVAITVIASAGWFAWYWLLSDDMREYRLSQQNPTLHPSAIYISHAHAATDLSDDRKLAGFVQNVFIGEVLEELGQTEERGWPETQFKVRVLELLKGKVNGEITVNQQGGYREADGSTYRREGDLNLLELGGIYLFATRTFPEKNWHTLMPGYGDIKIDAPNLSMSDEELLRSKHVVELRMRFKNAIENEIPQDPRSR